MVASPAPCIVLLTLGLASYRAWVKEHQRANDAERRIFTDRPQVVIEYTLPRDAQGNTHPTVRNTSAQPAYNIQLAPVANGDRHATFPPLARLEAGGHAHVHAEVEGVGPVFLHDFRQLLEHNAPEDLAAYANPLVLELQATYTDFAGTQFRRASRIEYNRVLRTACTVGVQG